MLEGQNRLEDATPVETTDVDLLALGVLGEVPSMDQLSRVGYERKVLGGTEATAKWGDALSAGYQVLPDAILRHWGRHNLAPSDLVVLLHLTMAWWKHDERPYPRATTIARRMAVTPRTVQRSLQRLRRANLVGMAKAYVKGETRRVFDLSGLASVAQDWAREDLEFQSGTASRPAKSASDGVQTRSRRVVTVGDR